MKQRTTKTLFSMLLTFLLVLGMLPAHALKVYADNWVNWEELFAGSGWYDTDEASEDSNNKETEAKKEKKSKKSKKNSQNTKNKDDQSNNKGKSESQNKNGGQNNNGSQNKNGSQNNNGSQNKNDSRNKNGSKNKNGKQNQNGSAGDEEETEDLPDEIEVEEDGTYTSKEEVAAYLNEFGHLPDNYITKKDAKKLGWVSSEGNLDEVAPGKSIGGDYFGNYEELLPVKKGRSYYECDIDFEGGFRGSKRIIFSDDGLIYYTEDHYQTFELLYGEE